MDPWHGNVASSFDCLFEITRSLKTKIDAFFQRYGLVKKNWFSYFDFCIYLDNLNGSSVAGSSIHLNSDSHSFNPWLYS